MAWSTPIPPAISAFRDMLVACASSGSFGLVQARFHYPLIDMNTSSSATRPCCLLDEVNSQRERYAEAGVLGNPSGTLTATIHAESSISTLEELARSLCSELTTQSTGLPIRSCTAGRSSNISGAQQAADDTTADNKSGFRSITITVEWGLSP